MTAQIHFETLGDGEPVVILHGLFGSGRNWFTIAKALANNYQIILPDARNHGKSAHTDSITYQDMAADIDTVLAELRLSNAHIIGHSMGGKTAMTLALNHPERVKSLTVLDIAPVQYQSEFENLISSMLSLDLDNIRSRQDANDALATYIPEDGLRAFLLHNLSREQNNYFWRVNLPLIHRELETICDFPNNHSEPHYDLPSLFLAGAKSDYVKTDHQEQIRQYFPHAQIEHIAEAGHWLHADQPEQVLQRLNSFLNENS